MAIMKGCGINILIQLKKSGIRETLNLSACADSSTDTIVFKENYDNKKNYIRKMGWGHLQCRSDTFGAILSFECKYPPNIISPIFPFLAQLCHSAQPSVGRVLAKM